MDHEELLAIGKAIARENRSELDQRRRQLSLRIDSALKEVQRLAEEFRKADPEIARIVLFGSLAEGRVTNVGFDIDLAVESHKYFRLVSIGLDSSFAVDVVDLPTASPHIRDAVRKHGKVIYDKSQASV